jgi:hypothetical protein
MLPAGLQQPISVVFTPADAIDYGSASASVLINVTAPACASDVSAQVSMTRGGFAFNPGTGRFSQLVKVTNVGGAPLQGPVSLVLDALGANATLFNATGATGCAAPLGSPILTLALGGLAPGVSATIPLQFTNPTRTAITYHTRVLAGAGAQ